jgi:hypothetical protein
MKFAYIKSILVLSYLTICVTTQTNPDISQLQIQRALMTAQQALNVYQRNAPEQEYALLYEYMQYYRSWYQAVTPAPIQLVEQLSPAALKFIAQLKYAAQPFTRAPRNMPGSSRLTAQGEQFFQAVVQMVRSQLLDKQLARIAVIPHMQTRLV